MLTVLIAIFLYLSVDPSFSLITHYLSDLGAGPNGSNFVFNIGMIITSIIMVAFYIHLSLILYMKKGYKFLIIISFCLGLISAIGTFFVGIFPVNISQDIHNFSASFFFLGGLGAALFYTLTEFTTPKFSHIQAFSGIVIICSFLLFIVYNALNYFNPGQYDLESHITEWILYFIIIFWIVEHAIIVFKLKIHKTR